MRVHEQIERLEHKPLNKVGPVTQAEVDYAWTLVDKYLIYLAKIASDIRLNVLNEEERQFVVDIHDRLARQGKMLRMPNRPFRPF